MSNELIDELNEYADHCASSGQFQASDLISRAVAALQPSLPQDMEPEILSELLDSAMVSTGEIVPDKPSHPQDVEEWIERNELVVAAGSEVNSVIKTSALRAFLAGKVLVPVEPTKEMVVAGHHAAWRRIPSIFDFDDAENVYKAMLTASKEE